MRGLLNLMRFRMAVSGSSSRLASREIIVFPFSFREFLKARKFRPTSLELRGGILGLFREYLQFGGFPEIVLEAGHISPRSRTRT